MEKRTVIIFIIALVALVGMGHCILIEPALANEKTISNSPFDSTHCGFTCHSIHHAWLISEGSLTDINPSLNENIFLKNKGIYIDSFASSIFHPPRAF